MCLGYKENPVVGFSMATVFNESVAIDLGELDEDRFFLLMVDMTSHYCQRTWVKSKIGEMIAGKIVKSN